MCQASLISERDQPSACPHGQRAQRENIRGLEAGRQEQPGTDRTGYQAGRTGCCSE